MLSLRPFSRYLGSFEGRFLIKAFFSLYRPYFPRKAVSPDGNVVFSVILKLFEFIFIFLCRAPYVPFERNISGLFQGPLKINVSCILGSLGKAFEGLLGGSACDIKAKALVVLASSGA